MSKKLAKFGVIQIEDSSIFVADLSCYPDAMAFATAVAKEIKSDPEWYVSPKPESIVGWVTTGYMRYGFEEEGDEPKRGNYYLEDRTTLEEQVLDRLSGREVFLPLRTDTKVWYVDMER